MKATIEHIEVLSPRVRHFVLSLTEPVVFQAGQFVVLTAVVDGEQMQRSYSIASDQSGVAVTQLELCISLNEDGKVTPWLFSLEKGAVLEISEPQGGFVLRPTSETEDVIFVCTGTGVAPFRSMIQSCLASNPNRKVHLVFGNRHESDVLYHQYWLAMQESQKQFFYHPVLSRVNDADVVKGFLTGYVHPIYQQLLQENANAHVYVCGWEVMCTEARQCLKAMGLTRRQYFFEQYDG